jgi:hypothetical protein
MVSHWWTGSVAQSQVPPHYAQDTGSELLLHLGRRSLSKRVAGLQLILVICPELFGWPYLASLARTPLILLIQMKT